MNEFNDFDIERIYNKIAPFFRERSNPMLFYNEYTEMPATLSLLENVKGKKILDLGCGTGRYSRVLIKMGATVFGIDASTRMIEVAKTDIKGVDFRVASAYRLPFRANYFDFVVAGLAITNFGDVNRAFKEVRRVLKKGGAFVFSMHNPIIAITHSIKGKPRVYRRFNDYFDERPTMNRWHSAGLDVTVPHIRKTYQTWIKLILGNGFSIAGYVDAKPLKKAKDIDGARYRAQYNFISKVPYFCVFKVRKI